MAKRLSTSIKRADSIVRSTWLSGAADVRFKHGKTSTIFTGLDTITGLPLGGNYGFDKRGIINQVAFITPQNGAIPKLSLFTVLQKGSKNAFSSYSNAFNGSPPFIAEAAVIALTTGNGQQLANANELLPGVQSGLAPSTVVTINGVDFYA